MGTQEQIIADCEKRYEELRKEAERPERLRPCETCRWKEWRWKSLREGPTCHEPLVKGFTKDGHNMGSGKVAVWFPELCGPEKALWQPKPNPIKRAKEWWDADTGGWPTLIALASLAAFFWSAAA